MTKTNQNVAASSLLDEYLKDFPEKIKDEILGQAAKAASRHVLALALLNIFFTNEEMSQTCYNKKSAAFKPLDDNKINQLKEVVFIIKPLIENENKTKLWKEIFQKIKTKCRFVRFKNATACT